jgi:hypothetical protein
MLAWFAYTHLNDIPLVSGADEVPLIPPSFAEGLSIIF